MQLHCSCAAAHISQFGKLSCTFCNWIANGVKQQKEFWFDFKSPERGLLRTRGVQSFDYNSTLWVNVKYKPFILDLTQHSTWVLVVANQVKPILKNQIYDMTRMPWLEKNYHRIFLIINAYHSHNHLYDIKHTIIIIWAYLVWNAFHPAFSEQLNRSKTENLKNSILV